MSWSSPHASSPSRSQRTQAVDVDERVPVDDHPADRLADGAQRPAVRVGGRRSRPGSTQPCVGSRCDRALPAGEADRAPVAAQEPVGDRVVAVGVVLVTARKRVVGRRRAGHVGGLAGPVLGPRSPGAVPHGQAVDRRAARRGSSTVPVTRPNWSKWWAEPNVEPTAASGSGGITPVEAQLQLAGGRRRRSRGRRTASARRPGSTRPSAASTSRRSASGGQLERRVVRAVEHLPRQPGGVVPHPGAAGDGADVRPHHRVEPAAEPALRVVEREPRRLGLPPAVAQHVGVEAVVVRPERRRRSAISTRAPGPALVEHDGDRPRRAGQAEVGVAAVGEQPGGAHPERRRAHGVEHLVVAAALVVDRDAGAGLVAPAELVALDDVRQQVGALPVERPTARRRRRTSDRR